MAVINKPDKIYTKEDLARDGYHQKLTRSFTLPLKLYSHGYWSGGVTFMSKLPFSAGWANATASLMSLWYCWRLPFPFLQCLYLFSSIRFFDILRVFDILVITSYYILKFQHINHHSCPLSYLFGFSSKMSSIMSLMLIFRVNMKNSFIECELLRVYV